MTDRHKKQKLHNLFIATEGLVIFTLIFLSIMIYANWAAVVNEIGYAAQPKSTPVPTTPSTPIVATPATPTPTPIVEPAHIVIDKISVDAPIQWDIPVNDTVEALNHGLAHLDGSARPGEVGNLFLTGHSSDYVWKKNPYAAVFSLLPKLAAGDVFSIRENGSEYIYRVSETKIVNPDQVEVAAPTENSMATLMTCYPIGSTRQRFVVQADLISSPTLASKKTSSTPQTLPEIRFR
jgi:LPXTG-site transpeptidase (sortase) family protein